MGFNSVLTDTLVVFFSFVYTQIQLCFDMAIAVAFQVMLVSIPHQFVTHLSHFP